MHGLDCRSPAAQHSLNVHQTSHVATNNGIGTGINDIINALPFDLPKRLLTTYEGQIVYFLVFLFAVAVVGPSMIQKFWRCVTLCSNEPPTSLISDCISVYRSNKA